MQPRQAVFQYLMNYRDCKRRGFPGACVGLDHYIVPFHSYRDGVPLDRCWLIKAAFLDVILNLLIDLQILELIERLL